MGLIISVLVVCVGVYKFIEIYCDTQKKVGYETTEICHTNSSSKNSAPSDTTPRVKLQRDFLSHEDVEIECTSTVLNLNSKSSSSRRFLVSEKNDNCSRDPSPRKFVITEDDAGTSDLREFLIAKGTPKDNPDTKRFILIDTKEDFKEVSPLPLPKQFVITQASSSISHGPLDSTKKGIGIDLNCLRFNGKEIENLKSVDENIETLLGNTSEVPLISKDLPCFSLASPDSSSDLYPNKLLLKQNVYKSSVSDQKDKLSSTSVYEIYSNEPEEFHRDPSPYPSLDVSIRRGSISSDLLDNAKVSMAEVDEEPYNTMSKIDVILKSSNFNTTEYWSNKILVEPPKSCGSRHSSKNKSVSISGQNEDDVNIAEGKKRSKSATRNGDHTMDGDMRRVNSSSKMYEGGFQEPSSLFINILNKGEDEEFRNSLDGVKRGSEGRRSFKKRKNRSQNSLDNEENYAETDRISNQKNIAADSSRVNTMEL